MTTPYEASLQIDDIVEQLDGLPAETIEKAEKFFMGARETLVGIQETVDKTNRLSPRQRETIEKIGEKIGNWAR